MPKSRHIVKSFTTKEENIAIRLSGKVKNFTGRSPAVIKVKFENALATVQFKWMLTSIEKQFLHSCQNKDLVNSMRNELLDVARRNLNRAFSEVFNSEVEILEVNEDILQEKLRIQLQVMDLVS